MDNKLDEIIKNDDINQNENKNFFNFFKQKQYEFDCCTNFMKKNEKLLNINNLYEGIIIFYDSIIKSFNNLDGIFIKISKKFFSDIFFCYDDDNNDNIKKDIDNNDDINNENNFIVIFFETNDKIFIKKINIGYKIMFNIDFSKTIYLENKSFISDIIYISNNIIINNNNNNISNYKNSIKIWNSFIIKKKFLKKLKHIIFSCKGPYLNNNNIDNFYDYKNNISLIIDNYIEMISKRIFLIKKNYKIYIYLIFIGPLICFDNNINKNNNKNIIKNIYKNFLFILNKNIKKYKLYDYIKKVIWVPFYDYCSKCNNIHETFFDIEKEYFENINNKNLYVYYNLDNNKKIPFIINNEYCDFLFINKNIILIIGKIYIIKPYFLLYCINKEYYNKIIQYILKNKKNLYCFINGLKNRYDISYKNIRSLSTGYLFEGSYSEIIIEL